MSGMSTATLPSQRCSSCLVNGQDTTDAQPLDGSVEGLLFGSVPLCAHACERVHICVYKCVWKQRGKGSWCPVGADSYRLFNVSSNAKELQCHIHQSWLAVRARQRCWHLNASRWVKRPFKCQLADTQPCSHRWVGSGDCQLGTQEKGHCICEAQEEKSSEDSNENVFIPWDKYSVATITPVNSGISELVKL